MADQLRGRFVWHELMTTDTASAESFYKNIVGWQPAAWGHDSGYTLFMVGDHPAAGLMALPEDLRNMGVPPHWLTYLGTANVDDTAQQVAQLGGRVVKSPEDIPSAGRFAIVQDPLGAVFGLLTPAQSAGDAPPKLGEFSWHELLTDDPSAAWDFYQRVFGWEKTSAMDMGPEMGVYQMFGWNGRSVGGMFKRPANVPAHWMPYAMLADARAAAQQVAALGGRIVNGPMEVPGGDWIAQGIDLQGAVFAVHSPKPVTASAPIKAPGTAGAASPAVKRKAAPAKRKATTVKRKATPVKKSVRKAATVKRKTVRKKKPGPATPRASARGAARKTRRAPAKARAARTGTTATRKGVRATRKTGKPARKAAARSRRPVKRVGKKR